MKKTPLEINGVDESLYAGFWSRFGSILLDLLITLPVILLILYINDLGLKVYFITLIPVLIFSLWYNVYLVKKYGATPGQLIAGIKIIKINGDEMDWNTAILRHIVTFFITLISVYAMIQSIQIADESHYNTLSWLQKVQYLQSIAPEYFSVYNWLSNIWVWGELVVLLTNERKRAIHDFIAETVIIKTRHEVAIKEYMTTIQE